MNEWADGEIVAFSGFRLDRRGRCLSRQDRDGSFTQVTIGSRALEVLDALIDRRGGVISQDEIMKAVWPGTVVEAANVTVQISTLRRILDDGRAEGSTIQTVPGRGYRFAAPLNWVLGALPSVATSTQRDAVSGNDAADPTAPAGWGEDAVLEPLRGQTKSDRNEQSATAVAEPVPSAYLSHEASHRRRALFGAMFTASVLVIGVTGWWLWMAKGAAPGATVSDTALISRPLVAPRLSIVVLPITDLSEDRGQQYFADGITDDLTTDLSRLRNVLVISRGTAFTYKGQQVDAKQIGRELGVRYVLEGSVRRLGNQVRVNAQLIDAATNTHLWAEHFDHDIGNLFAIQNEITGRIANTLGWELIAAETARPTDRPDALDYVLRGRAASARGPARENFEEAITLFERALALDPHWVEAQTRLASALATRAMSKDPGAAAADLQRAKELIAQALETSPGDATAHRVKGRLLRFERLCAEAIPEIEIALSANRNDPFLLNDLSMCKYLTGGSDQEAIVLAEQAIRLGPRDREIWSRYFWIGFIHLLQSRTDEAIAWLEKARSLAPRAFQPHWFLAAAYGLKGELERARTVLAEGQRLLGSDRYSTIARTRANGDLYTPALRDRWETTAFPGIRAAGMPEE